MNNRSLITALVTASLGFAANPVAALPTFSVTDLGFLRGGSSTTANAINDHGQVVGDASTRDGQTHGFLYTNGVMFDLRTLEGDNSSATAINNSSQVVGASDIGDGSLRHAFLFEQRTMVDLGTLGGGNSFAIAINNSGQVVGVSEIQVGNFGGDRSGFSYDGLAMTDLRNEGYDLEVGHQLVSAAGINDSGQMVIRVDDRVFGAAAYLVDGTTLTNLGSLFGKDLTIAKGINNFGEVVGVSKSDSGDQKAFLYDGDLLLDLGHLGAEGPSRFHYSTVALDVNDQGQVVGNSDLGGDGKRAFFFDGMEMVQLDTLIASDDPLYGLALHDSRGVNNQGQVIANGADGHAYLLTPITPTSVEKLYCSDKFDGDVNPDTGTFSFKIPVEDTGILTDIKVGLMYTPEWVFELKKMFSSDLTMTLSHNSTGTFLASKSEDNLASCFSSRAEEYSNYLVLDDNAPISIQTRCPPKLDHSRSYKPADSLAAFNDKDVAGDWTVTISYPAKINKGSFVKVCLQMSTIDKAQSIPGDFNKDGKVDGSDLNQFEAWFLSKDPRGDLDKSGGAPNFTDLGLFEQYWFAANP